jgi:hypothetical protein
LVSASTAVHVQTSPATGEAFFAGPDVLRLGVDEAPNLVELEALAEQVAKRPILISEQAAPVSAGSFTTVFSLGPVRREIGGSTCP